MQRYPEMAPISWSASATDSHPVHQLLVGRRNLYGAGGVGSMLPGSGSTLLGAFAAIRTDDQRMVAVVAQQLGPGPHGDQAVRILGNSLLAWLWDLRYSPPSADQISAYLDSLSVRVDAVLPGPPPTGVAARPIALGVLLLPFGGQPWVYLLGPMRAVFYAWENDRQVSVPLTGDHTVAWVGREPHGPAIAGAHPHAFGAALISSQTPTGWGLDPQALYQRPMFDQMIATAPVATPLVYVIGTYPQPATSAALPPLLRLAVPVPPAPPRAMVPPGTDLRPGTGGHPTVPPDRRPTVRPALPRRLVLGGLALMVGGVLLAILGLRAVLRTQSVEPSTPTVASPAVAGDQRCFLTGACLQGRPLALWRQYGGQDDRHAGLLGVPLTVNGVSTASAEQTIQFRQFLLAWHPDRTPPDDLQFDPLAATKLKQLGWSALPATRRSDSGCTWVAQTQHNLCGEFRQYWEIAEPHAAALYGNPLSEAETLTVNDIPREVQWFQQVRLDAYPDGGSLLADRVRIGLLDAAVARLPDGVPTRPTADVPTLTPIVVAAAASPTLIFTASATTPVVVRTAMVAATLMVPSAVSTAIAPLATQEPALHEYLIQYGDTLTSIALKFCTKDADLKRMNNIVNANQIAAVTIIKVPVVPGCPPH